MLGYGLVGGPGAAVASVATDVVYAAAVILLAIGLTREGSVVARRPLGLSALVAVALWPLASSVIAGLLEARSPEDAAVWTTYGYLSLFLPIAVALRSEEHTSELQSLMRISYAVFCLKKTNKHTS